ncbi:translation initiation factor eIF-1A [Candidatus Woesearchaeota archaeon]|nr:translation initiation factor eIF-1A [Candidatus Woesearchaeota archaeon]
MKQVAQNNQGDLTQEEIRTIRLPRNEREVIGVVDQRLGGGRTRVRCLDGKARICRVPGRLRRRLWIRTGDIVLVEKWELQGDKKGDIIFKYRPTQVAWLKRQGYLEGIEEIEEF